MMSFVIGGGIGLALAMTLYTIYRIFSEVPDEDRTYLDKPPRLLRLTWPIVNMVAFNIGPFVTERYAHDILVKLRRGGQDYALNANQFAAAKVISALVFGTIATMACSVLGKTSLGLFCAFAGAGWFYPNLWLAELTKKRNLQLLKALPFFLDILTLSVEAGLNLSSAMQQAASKSPPGPMVFEVERVLRETRAGRSRVEALRSMAERLDFTPITNFIVTLVQAELMGTSLGPILRVQSEQRRAERFQRAEKLAMEAPVKMLGPLILCIFPCTFVVIAFPIVVKFLGLGLHL